MLLHFIEIVTLGTILSLIDGTTSWECGDYIRVSDQTGPTPAFQMLIKLSSDVGAWLDKSFFYP